MASQEETRVDPFDPLTWPDYDPHQHEAKLIAFGRHCNKVLVEDPS